MKKLKLMLTTLSILFALSVVSVPVQTVQASGGPQGTSDSQRRSTQEAKAAALWAWIMKLLGW